MLRFRKGLSGLKNQERMVMLYALHNAEQLALQEAVDARLARSPLALCDCSDIRVRSSTVLWARKQRRLYARITVYLAGDPVPVQRAWRLSTAGLAPTAFAHLCKRPLK